jgi:hypothetical protein
MTTVQLLIASAVPVLLIVAIYRVFTRGHRPNKPQRRYGGVGTAAVGTIYDMLNEEKRRAVEIIVEGRAEERRPEYPDGNLPDLESPDKKRT